jgi:hypothetical protein
MPEKIGKITNEILELFSLAIAIGKVGIKHRPNCLRAQFIAD